MRRSGRRSGRSGRASMGCWLLFDREVARVKILLQHRERHRHRHRHRHHSGGDAPTEVDIVISGFIVSVLLYLA